MDLICSVDSECLVSMELTTHSVHQVARIGDTQYR